MGALPSGEWGIHNRGAGPGGGYAVERGIVAPETVALVLDADTARFIAWSYNAMPDLLDAAARATAAEAEVARLRAEIAGVRSGLAFYKPEAERYRAALRTIRQWDCLNPPRPDLLGDLPWLRQVVDGALAGGERGASDGGE